MISKKIMKRWRWFAILLLPIVLSLVLIFVHGMRRTIYAKKPNENRPIQNEQENIKQLNDSNTNSPASFPSQKISQLVQKTETVDFRKIKNKKDASLNQLTKLLSEEIYPQINQSIKEIINTLLAGSLSGSWLGEGQGLYNIRKRHNPAYKELRVWKLEDDNAEEGVETYIEMRTDGMDYGRIMQMKEGACHGFYIDFYDKSLHIFRVCHGNTIMGQEIAYQKGTNQLLSFSYQENGKTVGPAFFWDANGVLIDFKYHTEPVSYPRFWPPPIRTP